MGGTAPFVQAQTGLPLQVEERGFFRGGPPKSRTDEMGDGGGAPVGGAETGTPTAYPVDLMIFAGLSWAQ